MCHQADTDSFDDASCPASQHADMKDQCMSCHDDPNMERAHSKVEIGDTKKKATLKRTAVTRESCTTSCHDQAELTEKGAAATVLTDKNGLTVNPHELPAHEEHERIVPQAAHLRQPRRGGAGSLPELPPRQRLRVQHLPRALS